jgi:hypothetical protein
LRRHLGERGRATAERQYSWNVIGRNMIEVYHATSAAGPGSVASAGAAPVPMHRGRFEESEKRASLSC